MFESMNSITVHGLSGSTILVFFSLMTSTNTNLTCNSYRLIIWRLCVWSLCTLRWFCCDIGGCGQLRWWQSIPCFVWSPTEIVEEIHTCHVVSCIYDEFVGFVFCFYIFIIICLFFFFKYHQNTECYDDFLFNPHSPNEICSYYIYTWSTSLSLLRKRWQQIHFINS